MVYPFELTKTTITINQIILFTATILWMFVGTPQEWMIAFVVYLIKATITTAVIHRGLSHQSFNMNKWVEYSLATIALAGTNSTPISWVAIHRQHHHYSDQPNDPHSPLFVPLKKILMSDFDKVPWMYAKDLLKSNFYHAINKWHWMSSLIVISVLVCIDPRAVVYAWLIPLFLQIRLAALVNALNHSNFGYRNHNTSDNSHNNFITGLIVAGEGWHNNHHQDSKNPNFSNKWWEFDLGYQLVKIIRK